ncbi:MAG: trypsin-like peptidase domain-containing protein [Oscillospiraceae bacterium]|nr:trypsin-like peptidase domain-containing protein [Oscillospiraceae bacterium]
MSDFDDSLSPQDPEIEYANQDRSVREGYYGTGDTTPPKDHVGVISLVLVLVVGISSLISVLSLLNVKVFREPEPTQLSAPVSFYVSADGVLSAELEPREPAVTEPPVLEGINTRLEITASPQSLENTAEIPGAISWQEVYEKVMPSVVSITCHDGRSTSSGTGVIMDAGGYIITNAHVVEDAQVIQVLLTDGRELDARCVGADVLSDLAVLKVNAIGLTPAVFGDSDKLRVGDEVVAIGDPLGVELRGTMTNGIISGINRDIKSGNRTLTLMQTTAALNTGNSGGPLVNCYGQVVGINTMKIGDYASESGVEGLGFAIPITSVQTVLEQLANQGYVAGRPDLGITGTAISTFYQFYYRMPAGILITAVDEDSDAAAQGLRRGDILMTLDSKSVTSLDILEEIIYASSVGDKLEATIYRDGREYPLTITVGEEKH